MGRFKSLDQFIGVKTRNQKYKFVDTPAFLIHKKKLTYSSVSLFPVVMKVAILQVSIAVQKNRDTQQQHQQPHHQPQSYGRVQQQQSRQYGMVQQHS